jgi:hypothetical protein
MPLKSRSQTTPQTPQSARPPDETPTGAEFTGEPSELLAKPGLPLRRQPQPQISPIQVNEWGGVKSADPCACTATQIHHEFPLLSADIQHARAMIRSQTKPTPPSKLRKAFRGPVLDRWADNEEWRIMNEEYSKPTGRVASAKELARAILRRKTGLTDATLKTYLKRRRHD